MTRIALPDLDRDSIREEQTALVARELAGITDPVKRLRKSAEIVNTAQADFDHLRPRRDAYALSLWAHDGIRALNRAIGVNRTRWYEIRGDIDPGAVRHYITAASKLPGLATETAEREERARAARVIRDGAISELLDAGWSRPDIAAIIGRNPSRISHIKGRAAAVA